MNGVLRELFGKGLIHLKNWCESWFKMVGGHLLLNTNHVQMILWCS